MLTRIQLDFGLSLCRKYCLNCGETNNIISIAVVESPTLAICEEMDQPLRFLLQESELCTPTAWS